MSIAKEFKDICGFELFTRQTNHLFDRIERKDSLFSQLAILYFSHPRKFNELKRKINDWLKIEQNETIFALAGYICYISEDFKKAKEYFLKTISLNPDNLDNWIDLAFTLRHLCEYRISNGIIFNYDYLMHYYKYLKLYNCSYTKLKRLILEIAKRALSLNA